MKKSLAILLALVLVLALSACAVNTGGGANQDGKAASASEVSSVVQRTSSKNTPSQNNSTMNNPMSQSSNALIARERAIELALQEAGFARNAVRDLEAELDRERGGVIWEVDFEAAGYEYSYDINAETGAVVKQELDRED